MNGTDALKALRLATIERRENDCDLTAAEKTVLRLIGEMAKAALAQSAPQPESARKEHPDRLSGATNQEWDDLQAEVNRLRAALAQSAPQPKPRDTHHEYARAVDEAKAMIYGPQPESSDPEPVDIYRDSAPWKPIAAGPAREPPICMGPSARQIAHIQLGELIRLQDRDKWIEEHAKPALEYAQRLIGPTKKVTACLAALAALERLKA